jgi:transcriptional regulator of acetoin/glycerol metabolism
VTTAEYVLFGAVRLIATASLEEIEKEHIIQVLAETPILEDAAARLGINASTLWRKRKRYKIE